VFEAIEDNGTTALRDAGLLFDEGRTRHNWD
jgi:hypothetical protein